MVTDGAIPGGLLAEPLVAGWPDEGYLLFDGDPDDVDIEVAGHAPTESELVHASRLARATLAPTGLPLVDLAQLQADTEMQLRAEARHTAEFLARRDRQQGFATCRTPEEMVLEVLHISSDLAVLWSDQPGWVWSPFGAPLSLSAVGAVPDAASAWAVHADAVGVSVVDEWFDSAVERWDAQCSPLADQWPAVAQRVSERLAQLGDACRRVGPERWEDGRLSRLGCGVVDDVLAAAADLYRVCAWAHHLEDFEVAGWIAATGRARCVALGAQLGGDSVVPGRWAAVRLWLALEVLRGLGGDRGVVAALLGRNDGVVADWLLFD